MLYLPKKVGEVYNPTLLIGMRSIIILPTFAFFELLDNYENDLSVSFGSVLTGELSADPLKNASS